MKEHRDRMTKDDIYTLPSLDEAPWLILTHKPKFDNQTFCLMNNKSYPKTIAELHGKSILASDQGWLVLQKQDNRSRYFVWNPVTRQCLNLPELLDPPKGEPTCMITSPPDGNAPCVVVLLFKSLLFSCRPTMSEDCRWIKQSLEHEGRSVELILAATTLNEDIYVHAYLNRRLSSIFARIKVIDSDSGSNKVLFEPIEIQPPSHRSIKHSAYLVRCEYLLEVCGVLYSVHVMTRLGMFDNEIIRIYVWRMDLFQMKWIQVKSLEDRAFLLGDNCCTWCWADTSCSGIEGNCIYITSHWNRTMHQYHLQDDSYILLKLSCDTLQSFNKPIWFMPRKPTRLSSGMLIRRELEDFKINIKHFEEFDVMEVDIPTPSLICQLPTDMLISITKYLHLFDYMNLRTTCKVLRSNIPRPQWRSNCSYPLFMSLKNTKDGICEVWDPCQNISHIIMTPHSPDLLSTVACVKDGWLLLRIEGQSLHCFNPFKGKTYKYPSHAMTDSLANFAFSTCPTSPDCLTVGIWGYKYSVRIIHHRAGNNQWESRNIEGHSETGIEFKSSSNSSPKYYDGSFYFLGKNGNLGALKMVDGEWIWKVHKGPILEDTFLYSCQLAELDDHLISVFIKENGERVQVFKFDSLSNDWVALDNLGDYMLFVSPASSFSVSTKDKNMHNRIYLPKRIGDEMVFYSLNDGMYHTSSGQHPSKDFYGMRSQSFCCWL